ncbi:hypothetical protein [Actinomycetospora termitidis]|uniref:Uncharacterized protein n=1 Tax=Actinomycetospora termitidis TaxID=3053470 RepID=A0ABT7MHX7_9PSEU|nr:hypothetical protein [Actinomycetospora sp. Odt1-22]MDL5160282.1 hypothetical protein [Actinomycetospora sp. Odt1-22]
MSAPSSRRWWGPAVAVCASVAALAGTVAAVATAVGADGESARRSEARTLADARPAPQASQASPAAAPASAPPVTTRPGRLGDPTLGATVALQPGWEPARTQGLVPVTPGRFPTVLTLEDRAVVLLGRLDPARGFGEDALGDEARRLVGAFTDGVRGDDDGRVVTVSDEAGPLDGRDAFTSVRRAPDGTIVRVTTVAGDRGEPGLVLLAVAAPGRTQPADAGAADRVVRSLSSDAGAAPPPTPGRAAAPPAAGPPGARVSPSPGPATGR